MPQVSDDVIITMLELIVQRNEEVKQLRKELADAQENYHCIQDTCARMNKKMMALKEPCTRYEVRTTPDGMVMVFDTMNNAFITLNPHDLCDRLNNQNL